MPSSMYLNQASDSAECHAARRRASTRIALPSLPPFFCASDRPFDLYALMRSGLARCVIARLTDFAYVQVEQSHRLVLRPPRR